MIALLAPLLIAAAVDDGGCRETRIHADGHISERVVADPGAAMSISSVTSGAGSSSVSVAATSGNGTSSATSNDGKRRTTVRRDSARCTITIDERPQP